MIYPPKAGVLSALGLLIAPLAFEFSRSLTAELRDLTIEEVRALLADLEAQGQALLAKTGVSADRIERSVDMYHVGQFYEVTTPIPRGALDEEGLNQLHFLLNEAYEQAYGRRLEGIPARTVTWRVLSAGSTPQLTLQADDGAGRTSGDATDGGAALKAQWRVLFSDHGATQSSIYARERLQAGDSLEGQALVEDFASTIAMPPGATAEVSAWGNIIVHWQRD